MNKDRITALSDGIVAIAATIMVLELAVPDTLSIIALSEQLPTLLAYIVSFAMIYASWRSHHNAFEKADVIDGKVFIANGVWLLLISLVPFSTGLMGKFPNSTLAANIYVLVILFWTLSFQFVDIAITNANPNTIPDETRGNLERALMFGGYLLALLSSFFIPMLGVIVIGIMIVIMSIRITKFKD